MQGVTESGICEIGITRVEKRTETRNIIEKWNILNTLKGLSSRIRKVSNIGISPIQVNRAELRYKSQPMYRSGAEFGGKKADLFS